MKRTLVLMIVLVICMSASAIAAEVFVSEIKMQLGSRGPKKAGIATIEIMNDSGQLVTSGTVSAQWSGAATNSTTTSIGSSGTAKYPVEVLPCDRKGVNVRLPHFRSWKAGDQLSLPAYL